MENLWLIAGLGNPGKRYERTWHNIGRMGADRLAERHGIAMRLHRFGGVAGEGRIEGQRVLLLQPDTFMNRSGESLIRALSFFKIPLDHLIVLYDDYDLPLGRIRIRETGSAGSHNGMKSVIDHVGSCRFWRVRVGIGPRPMGDIVDFVLSKISQRQEAEVFNALENAVEAIELILRGEHQTAQERFNKKGANRVGAEDIKPRTGEVSQATAGSAGLAPECAAPGECSCQCGSERRPDGGTAKGSPC